MTRTLVFILILTLIGLQYKLWFGDGSFLQWRQLEQKAAVKAQENDKLLARNRRIEAEIQGLKDGDQALEEQARDDLGMVKDGEVYYQFVE